MKWSSRIFPVAADLLTAWLDIGDEEETLNSTAQERRSLI